jgi:hypothetical protein
MLACGLIFVVGCQGNPGAPGIDQLPNDLQVPSVEIVLPLASKPLHRRSVIEVLYSDDNSVDSMRFVVDGLTATPGTITPRPSSPFVFQWDCNGLSLGQHTLLILAWDAEKKMGASQQMLLNLVEWGSPKRDTLSYYSEILPGERVSNGQPLEWNLPNTLENNITGVATRFTPEDTFRVAGVAIWLHRRSTWTGGDLLLKILKSKDGLPQEDDPVYTMTIHGQKDSLFISDPTPEFLDEKIYSKPLMRSSCRFGDDFFVTLELPPSNAGDTLAVFTDTGVWANGHGFKRDRDGEWGAFSSGSARIYNPLIRVIGYYQ